MLHRGIGEILSAKTFEQGHGRIRVEARADLLGRRNHRYKDLEVRRSFVCWRKSKEASVPGGGRAGVGEGVEEIAEVRLCEALKDFRGCSEGDGKPVEGLEWGNALTWLLFLNHSSCYVGTRCCAWEGKGRGQEGTIPPACKTEFLPPDCLQTGS